jgi:DNA-directed RNA polymerase specialized sigma24 family protein
MPAGSVSHWLELLKEGDRAAAQPLWEHYFRRLVELARRKLQGGPRRVADEEDVALSAFASFCRGLEAGRYPQLDDREDLWQLLVLITAHKALDRLRHERRLKRRADRHEDVDLLRLVGREPIPLLAAQVAEEFRRLLQLLNDSELMSLARWKMEGYTTQEMAEKLGYVPRTIERKLRLIRTIWSAEIGQ